MYSEVIPILTDIGIFFSYNIRDHSFNFLMHRLWSFLRNFERGLKKKKNDEGNSFT